MEENANGIAGSGGDGDEKTPRQIDADVLQSRADILRAQNFAGAKPRQTCTGIIPVVRSQDDLNMNTPKISDASADKSTDGATDKYIDKSTEKPLPVALRPLGASVGSGHVRLEQRPVDVVLIDKRTDTAASVPDEAMVARAPVPDEAMTIAAATDSEVSSQGQAEGASGVGSDVRARAVIPEFNLAKRILAEQRRVVAGRRQRSTNSQDTPVMRGEARGIGHVVSRINRGDRPCGLSGSDAGAGHFAVLSTDTEQFVMADIVAADIARLCGRI